MSEPIDVETVEDKATIETLGDIARMADEIMDAIGNLYGSNLSLKLTIFVRLSSATRIMEQSGHDVTFLRHISKGLEEIIKKEMGQEAGQKQIDKLVSQEEEISKVLQLVQEILECPTPNQDNSPTNLN